MFAKARFKRRIFVASNAIETKDNEASHLIIFVSIAFHATKMRRLKWA